MSTPRTYLSVAVRTTGRPNRLEVVARQHLELGVTDTGVREEVEGAPVRRGVHHDTDTLSSADPVEAAVLRVWDRAAEAGPDPMMELKRLVRVWRDARLAYGQGDRRADGAAHEVVEFIAPYLLGVDAL